SVLGGAAVSSIMPFRTGEYLGRLVYVKNENKLKAAALSVAGSVSQLLMTLVLGMLAFPFIYVETPGFSISLPIYLTALFILFLLAWKIRRKVILKNKYIRNVYEGFKMLGRADVLRLLGFSF